MCCCCQDNTKYQKERCEYDACTSANAVDEKSEEKLAKDLADEIRIRQASCDLIREAFLVELTEDRLHVTNDLCIVTSRR